jgi:hypothetical protein
MTTQAKREANSVVPVRILTVKSMQQDIALINKGLRTSIAMTATGCRAQPLREELRLFSANCSIVSEAENFYIIHFSIRKFHKTKHFLVFCVGY